MANHSEFTTKTDEIYDRLSKLTKVQRIVICLLTVVVLSVAFVFFFYMPLNEDLSRLSKKHESLKKTLESHKKKAMHLPRYKKKMEQAMAEFTVAMKKLPEKKDIPVLLASISGAAQDAGLEILLFQPQAIAMKEFYAEIPVAINVKGSYHKTAAFFDNVSRLSRIVNIKNISMKQDSVSCMAVTYMFIEPKEGKKK